MFLYVFPDRTQFVCLMSPVVRKRYRIEPEFGIGQISLDVDVRRLTYVGAEEEEAVRPDR